jgi:Flp pilus assembly protein TadG
VTVSVGRRRREGGQALLEFALVFPIIVLVVVGGLEIGRAVNDYNTLTNAARQGARVAAVNQITAHTECDESRPVEDALNAHWSAWGCVMAATTAMHINSGDIEVTYAAPSGTTLDCTSVVHVGCIASVKVTYHYQPATPVGKVIGAITMTTTSTMPVERVFP